MDKITLTTKLSIEDYRKLNFFLLYRKWEIKYLTALGVLTFAFFTFNFYSFNSYPWGQLMFAFILTVGHPALVYFQVKKNYASNERIGERITFEVDKENIQIIGESFSTTFTWNKIYGVTESKNWIIIWQNQQMVNAMQKRDFQEKDLLAFKAIVRLHFGANYKFK